VLDGKKNQTNALYSNIDLTRYYECWNTILN